MCTLGTITEEAYYRIRDLISNECGFRFDNPKALSLESCIRKRMKAVQTETYNDYLEYIDRHSNGLAELKELIASITVNETNFFRHPDQFKAFRDHVIPEIIDQKLKRGLPAEPIASIWSAGCSTGDEAYTIALQVCDALDPFYANNVEILGTDIDEKVLSRARDGVFGNRTLQYVKDRLVDNYFNRLPAGYKIKDEIKNRVQFRYHNLVSTPYPKARWIKWDVIFCRNVIIYFDEETVTRVLNNLYESLADGGYLFLGYSESLNGIFDKLTLCRFGEIFAYRKDSGKRKRVEPQISAPMKTKEIDQVPVRTTMLVQLRELIEAEKYDKAIAKAQAMLGVNPNDAEARTNLARAYMEKGLPEEAAREAALAIESDPLQTHAYFILGMLCGKQKDYVHAVKHLRRALYLDDSLVMASLHLATIYQETGQIQDAVREHRNAIRLLERLNPEETLEFSGGIKTKSILEMCKRIIEKT